MKEETAAVRFLERIEPEPMSGCWIWLGCRTALGYGRFRNEYAHRTSYRRWVGEIPDDLELDHRCRLPSCVNPDHLRAVSHQENISRAHFPQAARTACPAGHPYDDENTFTNHRGWRWCRACLRAANRSYYHRNREKILAYSAVHQREYRARKRRGL